MVDGTDILFHQGLTSISALSVASFKVKLTTFSSISNTFEGKSLRSTRFGREQRIVQPDSSSTQEILTRKASFSWVLISIGGSSLISVDPVLLQGTALSATIENWSLSTDEIVLNAHESGACLSVVPKNVSVGG